MDDAPLVKYKLVTSWYEFILDREKLYLHLKRLCEDVNGEKQKLLYVYFIPYHCLVSRSQTTFL